MAEMRNHITASALLADFGVGILLAEARGAEPLLRRIIMDEVAKRIAVRWICRAIPLKRRPVRVKLQDGELPICASGDKEIVPADSISPSATATGRRRCEVHADER